VADLRDAAGRAIGPSGGRRGRVTGTFFHAIAGFDATPSRGRVIRAVLCR